MNNNIRIYTAYGGIPPGQSPEAGLPPADVTMVYQPWFKRDIIDNIFPKGPDNWTEDEWGHVRRDVARILQDFVPESGNRRICWDVEKFPLASIMQPVDRKFADPRVAAQEGNWSLADQRYGTFSRGFCEMVYDATRRHDPDADVFWYSGWPTQWSDADTPDMNRARLVRAKRLAMGWFPATCTDAACPQFYRHTETMAHSALNLDAKEYARYCRQLGFRFIPFVSPGLLPHKDDVYPMSSEAWMAYMANLMSAGVTEVIAWFDVSWPWVGEWLAQNG